MIAPVDVVVTWVDDRDAAWRALRDEHLARSAADPSDVASSDRFRDWDLLRFWFRGIAAHCPWVGTVHLVTQSPPPDWLDTTHPRVRIVRHEDFIPREYLPTFNSRTIELNLHRIEGLADRFVSFNDDMFVLRPIDQTHFFRGDLPVGFAVMNALSLGDNVSHAMLNDVHLLNARFAKRKVIRTSPRRWFTPRYGRGVLQNLALAPWPKFTGFLSHHLPLPMRRATMARVWDEAGTQLERTCRSTFRSFTDVNVFLFAWWALCENAFAPANPRRYGTFIQLDDASIAHACAVIAGARTPIVCLNDGPLDFEPARARLAAAFAALLPAPCEFERHQETS
ncbi:stealth conserved region 3 domain-containing protein [Microbacterium sp. zg-YB36]|uniref:stealth conserved region 3 domain-containing protein n=1 Tax=Microbacterium sp. zg-YB36 TaxID=2969407 RepID=UPI00214BDC92|nr:stealth conserved region 3 domain-containing protein [Microbacterium sp. zg-YB36]MDL5352760.1 hypothetical protein [Microbacterium sp. zg-YB36]